MSKMKIGVLALQGAFHLHKAHLEALGVDYVEVVTKKDLENLDGIILPGGESGTMLKLMKSVGIENELINFLKRKPSWGICAGAILLSSKVENPAQESFHIIDIEITRNAYGRQLQSVEESIENYTVSYIRAPKISKVGAGVTVLAKKDNDPTWVLSGKSMVTTFHPETNLNLPSPWHRRFVELCL